MPCTCADADIDPALLCQRAGWAYSANFGSISGMYPCLAALEEHETDLVPCNEAVVAGQVCPRECRYFAQQLDADQSPADDDKRKLFTLPLRQGLNVSPFEGSMYVVPQQQSVGQICEREGEGSEPGIITPFVSFQGPARVDQTAPPSFAPPRPNGQRGAHVDALHRGFDDLRGAKEGPRTGNEQWCGSREPEQTLNSSGVMSRKLSRC